MVVFFIFYFKKGNLSTHPIQPDLGWVGLVLVDQKYFKKPIQLNLTLGHHLPLNLIEPNHKCP